MESIDDKTCHVETAFRRMNHIAGFTVDKLYISKKIIMYNFIERINIKDSIQVTVDGNVCIFWCKEK